MASPPFERPSVYPRSAEGGQREAESVDSVLTKVLDIAFEALPVDRGFILLSDDQGELVCELMRVKDRVELRPSVEVPVSRTMLRAVMRERVALVTFDAQSDQRLSGGESIRLHQIRAAMCGAGGGGDPEGADRLERRAAEAGSPRLRRAGGAQQRSGGGGRHRQRPARRLHRAGQHGER